MYLSHAEAQVYRIALFAANFDFVLERYNFSLGARLPIGRVTALLQFSVNFI